MIAYTVIRSDRKTLSMQIGKDGTLIVRAPKRCSKAYIDEFVRKHEVWAVKNQARMQDIISARQEYRLSYGEHIPFCGNMLTVHLTSEKKLVLNMENKTLTVPELPIEELKDSLYRLYKKAGREWLRQRLDYWSTVMNIPYGNMKIGSATKRWGSCTREGNINLSWLNFFAPVEVVDYLLVHELSHRAHFDHSPAFWAHVERYIPDYKARKKQMNAVYRQLLTQGWAVK